MTKKEAEYLEYLLNARSQSYSEMEWEVLKRNPLSHDELIFLYKKADRLCSTLDELLESKIPIENTIHKAWQAPLGLSTNHAGITSVYDPFIVVNKQLMQLNRYIDVVRLQLKFIQLYKDSNRGLGK